MNLCALEPALEWARTAERGDYLSYYTSRDSSLCGYAAQDLYQVKQVLRRRDLTLMADDLGLVVCRWGFAAKVRS